MTTINRIKNDVRIIISEVRYELGDAGFKNPGYTILKQIDGHTSISAIRECIDEAIASFQYEFGFQNTVCEMLSKIK